MANISYGIILFALCMLLNIHPGARAIGINYGLMGDNLPAPTEVVALLKSRGISKIRLFEPRPDVLTALQGSKIMVILGTRNGDLQPLAIDPAAATAWVATNVLPYASSIDFKCISAGNEVIPGELAQYVPRAMENLDAALRAANLVVPVSTTVSMAVLGTSYPPSQGAFATECSAIMAQVTSFLQSKKSPLLLNVYPWFPRLDDPTKVPLEYALFLDSAKPVPDGSLNYLNLFDAMLDAAYSALEKAGGSAVEIIVSETGWPTAGNAEATIANAQTYNSNMIKHVSSGQGTPKRPNTVIEAFIFALFNENLKPVGVEQHWGLYNPDRTEVYHVEFPA